MFGVRARRGGLGGRPGRPSRGDGWPAERLHERGKRRFGNDDLLLDTENEPQPAHAVTLDGQAFDCSAHRAVFDKLIDHSADLNGVPFDGIARLREGELRRLGWQ